MAQRRRESVLDRLFNQLPTSPEYQTIKQNFMKKDYSFQMVKELNHDHLIGLGVSDRMQRIKIRRAAQRVVEALDEPSSTESPPSTPTSQQKQFEAGRYRILHKTALTTEAELNSKKIKSLHPGEKIEITEIQTVKIDNLIKRIRGLLGDNSGWVTMMKLDTGKRFVEEEVQIGDYVLVPSEEGEETPCIISRIHSTQPKIFLEKLSKKRGPKGMDLIPGDSFWILESDVIRKMTKEDVLNHLTVKQFLSKAHKRSAKRKRVTNDINKRLPEVYENQIQLPPDVVGRSFRHYTEGSLPGNYGGEEIPERIVTYSHGKRYIQRAPRRAPEQNYRAQSARAPEQAQDYKRLHKMSEGSLPRTAHHPHFPHQRQQKRFPQRRQKYSEPEVSRENQRYPEQRYYKYSEGSNDAYYRKAKRFPSRAPQTSQTKELSPARHLNLWHRVCFNTLLRNGEALGSAQIRVLSAGEKVYVVELRGRRARVNQPEHGWCSLRSKTGAMILDPILYVE